MSQEQSGKATFRNESKLLDRDVEKEPIKAENISNYESLQQDREQLVPCRNYFKNGITNIDFVLVYEVPFKKRQSLMIDADVVAEQQMLDKRQIKFQKWRKKFLRNLRRAGLVLEMDVNSGKEKSIHYVKVNCPWQVLTNYAEQMNLRVPLQIREHKTSHWSGTLLKKIGIPNIMSIDVPKPPKLCFTCSFRKSKLKRYLGSDDQDEFFTQTDRSKIAYEVLQTAVYGKQKKAEQGTGRLLAEGVFTAAFPLHEGPFQLGGTLEEINPDSLSQRQVLYEYWAQWRRWYRYQPLDHIRNYFGEKIAMYFAWIGFYTAWLHPVAIIGLIIFIIGLIGMNSNVTAIEICENGRKYLMCPLCEYCSTWHLNSSCWKAKFSYLFDNLATVFFAIIMSFWGLLVFLYCFLFKILLCLKARTIKTAVKP